MRASASVILAVAALTASRPAVPTAASDTVRPRRLPATPVEANDNRTPAGAYVGDTLVLRLTIATVAWHFVGDSSPALTVAAFAEEGKTPTIPAPLIRVRAGTPIRVTIRNTFDDTLIVRGLSDLKPGCELPATDGDVLPALRLPPRAVS